MKFIGLIPARYASTRFPGKPLALLAGKPVIQHVYEQVAPVLDAAFVATDDERIYQTVLHFGGKAIMTSANHPSGTDRIAEALEKVGEEFDVVINIQGDEPFIQKEQITSLCRCFKNSHTQIATLGKPFETIEALENPNSPKIVTDNQGYALYFSRSIIPFIRNVEKADWLNHHTFLKHLGIYAYRSHVLKEITQLPMSSLERAESLEQLRWLQNGYKIQVVMTDFETVGIDTPDDLQRAEAFIRNRR
ncbi:MAG: 3-deoxy-manno-octulosonate cytidylyltransferase [Segatella oulorum]|uniref:3-deoxy-manno-octulosonate cytidylyltransferase n=1 Tax=Segatella oulorum TaxID=28136 RepID=UPI00360D8B49